MVNKSQCKYVHLKQLLKTQEKTSEERLESVDGVTGETIHKQKRTQGKTYASKM